MKAGEKAMEYSIKEYKNKFCRGVLVGDFFKHQESLIESGIINREDR